MTLQALREKVGDRHVLRDPPHLVSGEQVRQRHDRGLHRRLAEQESGQNLGEFFQAWLYEEGRPTSW